jgi:ribosomal protein S18 acetylase RimI-like enzyme
MRVEIVTEVDRALWDAFQRLVPQLTGNNPAPSFDHLVALVKSESSTLMVARGARGEVLGALSLTVYLVPTGLRAIIEDVIVDEAARGQGIGEALMRGALQLAREKGAGSVTLTSNSRRTAANRLYQRLGFVRRETNSFLYKFS